MNPQTHPWVQHPERLFLKKISRLYVGYRSPGATDWCAEGVLLRISGLYILYSFIVLDIQPIPYHVLKSPVEALAQMGISLLWDLGEMKISS